MLHCVTFHRLEPVDCKLVHEHVRFFALANLCVSSTVIDVMTTQQRKLSGLN